LLSSQLARYASKRIWAGQALGSRSEAKFFESFWRCPQPAEAVFSNGSSRGPQADKNWGSLASAGYFTVVAPICTSTTDHIRKSPSRLQSASLYLFFSGHDRSGLVLHPRWANVMRSQTDDVAKVYRRPVSRQLF